MNGSTIGRVENMTDIRKVAVVYFYEFFGL
jgi:hypothetical protein